VSIYRHPNSGYWWVRFTIRGREVRQSARTTDRKAAEEFEHALRARFWRAAQLGEESHSWKEATERWLREKAGKRSIERDERIFAIYRPLDSHALDELTDTALSDMRALREQGVSQATVNREFALIRAVLSKAAKDWRWLACAPKVPMAVLEERDPRWLTRQQFQQLVKLLPKHTADMARFAVATGLRRGNITGLTWDNVDLKGRVVTVQASQAKGKRGIAVPLNDEAVAVLKRWRGKHETHVFVFRKKPVYQVATRKWREAVKAIGQEGLRFHDLRHTWASWQAQAGTPAYAIRELGGWATEAMVRRYSHLSAGDLAAYAGRTLVKKTRNPV
jgi:integrase